MSTELEPEPLSLLPPSPPSEEEIELNKPFVPGKFDYTSDFYKEMLQTAYQAINILELWNFIKENPGKSGFKFSSDNRLDLIYNKIEELGFRGHSGCSFAFIMRDMQFIAKNGEKLFREKYLQAS